jgi:malonyl-CoA O-methyltransferase
MNASLTQRVAEDFGYSADTYEDFAIVQRQIMRQLLELLTPYMQEQAVVADIGCGPGLFADAVRADNHFWELLGLDIAEPMCDRARKRGMAVVRANAEVLPFADASCDAVFSSLCAQWLGDYAAFLREIYRVLKPGSVAAVATLGGNTLMELRKSFETFGATNRMMQLHDADEWRVTAEEAGFTLLHQHQTLWRYPYASLAQLLEKLRGLGATNKHESRPRGLTGAATFHRLDAHYKNHYGRVGGGVWASWQPLFFILKKPGNAA